MTFCIWLVFTLSWCTLRFRDCGFCNKLSVPRWTLEWVMKDFFCRNFDKQTISRFISIHFNIHNYRLLIIFFNVFVYIISSRTIVGRSRSTGWWNVLLKKKLNMTNKSAAVSISSLNLKSAVRPTGPLSTSWARRTSSRKLTEVFIQFRLKRRLKRMRFQETQSKEANHKRGKYSEVPDSEEVTNWWLWDKVKGKVEKS